MNSKIMQQSAFESVSQIPYLRANCCPFEKRLTNWQVRGFCALKEVFGEEHETICFHIAECLDSPMRQLEVLRQQYFLENDYEMVLFVENDMLEAAAKDRDGRIENGKKVKEIFAYWKKHREFWDYANLLDEQISNAIKNGNTNIMMIFIYHYEEICGRPAHCWEKALVSACTANSTDCVRALLLVDAKVGRFMEALGACVQQRNEETFDLIVGRMKDQSRDFDHISFFCTPQLFQQVIRVDWRKAAEIIFENRWKWSITSEEEERAKKVDGNVYRWMKDRGGCALDELVEADSFDWDSEDLEDDDEDW